VKITIEIADKQSIKLLEITAKRKEGGFSAIASEAIEQSLRALDTVEVRQRTALKLRGSLSRRQAERLRRYTSTVRVS
jgi:hypothetical protein